MSHYVFCSRCARPPRNGQRTASWTPQMGLSKKMLEKLRCQSRCSVDANPDSACKTAKVQQDRVLSWCFPAHKLGQEGPMRLGQACPSIAVAHRYTAKFTLWQWLKIVPKLLKSLMTRFHQGLRYFGNASRVSCNTGKAPEPRSPTPQLGQAAAKAPPPPQLGGPDHACAAKPQTH